nr:uncharacterized protein LOC105884738 [Microcebus murinus]
MIALHIDKHYSMGVTNRTLTPPECKCFLQADDSGASQPRPAGLSPVSAPAGSVLSSGPPPSHARLRFRRAPLPHGRFRSSPEAQVTSAAFRSVLRRPLSHLGVLAAPSAPSPAPLLPDERFPGAHTLSRRAGGPREVRAALAAARTRQSARCAARRGRSGPWHPAALVIAGTAGRGLGTQPPWSSRGRPVGALAPSRPGHRRDGRSGPWHPAALVIAARAGQDLGTQPPWSSRRRPVGALAPSHPGHRGDGRSGLAPSHPGHRREGRSGPWHPAALVIAARASQGWHPAALVIAKTAGQGLGTQPPWSSPRRPVKALAPSRPGHRSDGRSGPWHPAALVIAATAGRGLGTQPPWSSPRRPVRALAPTCLAHRHVPPIVHFQLRSVTS